MPADTAEVADSKRIFAEEKRPLAERETAHDAKGEQSRGGHRAALHSVISVAGTGHSTFVQLAVTFRLSRCHTATTNQSIYKVLQLLQSGRRGKRADTDFVRTEI